MHSLRIAGWLTAALTLNTGCVARSTLWYADETAAPAYGSVLINAGAAYTNETAVELTIEADGATAYVVADTPDACAASESWAPMTTTCLTF